jgi:hypothetical protein
VLKELKNVRSTATTQSAVTSATVQDPAIDFTPMEPLVKVSSCLNWRSSLELTSQLYNYIIIQMLMNVLKTEMVVLRYVQTLTAATSVPVRLAMI